MQCYPNAGLPNAMGGYDMTPDQFAESVKPFCELGLTNMLGGCCGTTPEHIGALAKMLERERFKPRVRPTKPQHMWLSGLEAIDVEASPRPALAAVSCPASAAPLPIAAAAGPPPSSPPPRDYRPIAAHPAACQSHPRHRPHRLQATGSYLNIGERCNIAGSLKFKKLILNGDYEKGLEIAKAQAEGGAQVIDVNMDEGLLDGEFAMKKFLNMLIPEPDISRLPICVDSSKFHVAEAGLKCCQGKCIFNSISLKEGEDEFIKKGKLVKRYGPLKLLNGVVARGLASRVQPRE